MMTISVVGMAVAQYTHYPSCMLAMSAVFMPKMELTVPSGRKMMVTMVKAYTALSCWDRRDSLWLEF